jgi:hypothetical protein
MTTIKRLLLISLVVLMGCSKEQTSEPTKILSGSYVSSAFILPDSADRSVDVQSSGGSIQLLLTEKNEYSATLIIPTSVSTIIGSGITKSYSGAFSFIGDTVKLDSSGFIVNAMKWNEVANSIESVSPARGGISFVLKKK